MIERWLQDESIETIAADTNVNERTVRRWLALARELLADRKEPFAQEELPRKRKPLITTESLKLCRMHLESEATVSRPDI